jgi:hypothetical protein
MKIKQKQWLFGQPEVLPLNHACYTLMDFKCKQLVIRTTRSVATEPCLLHFILSKDHRSFGQPEALPLNHACYTLMDIKRKQLIVRTIQCVATEP